MKNPFELLKPPSPFTPEPSWPPAWPFGGPGSQWPVPERLERTMRDWLNLQRDFAAAYTNWLGQLRDARTPADFLHAQQAGIALWVQWVEAGMRALSPEATEAAFAAAPPSAAPPAPPAAAPTGSAPAPAPAPHKGGHRKKGGA